MVKSNQDGIAESLQTQLAWQQERWVAFANKTLETASKLLELNWTLTKEMWDDSTVAAQQLLSAKNPQELFALDSGAIRSQFNRMLSYMGAATSIANNMQAELTKTAQTQFNDTLNKTTNAVEKSIGNSHETAPNPFELVKVAMENAKGGYEQWVATTKKVAEAMEENMKLMPVGAGNSTKKPTNSHKKSEA